MLDQEEVVALLDAVSQVCEDFHGDGLLRASTGKSAQPDVWGSAFTVYADAVEETTAQAVGQVLAEAYTQGDPGLSWQHSPRAYQRRLQRTYSMGTDGRHGEVSEESLPEWRLLEHADRLGVLCHSSGR